MNLLFNGVFDGLDVLVIVIVWTIVTIVIDCINKEN